MQKLEIIEYFTFQDWKLKKFVKKQSHFKGFI